LRLRRWGRTALGPAWDYLLFLRPRQWPVLTGQFAASVLVAPALAAALSGLDRSAKTDLHWSLAGWAWLAWVVLLNGGTLAFNSAYDRDTEDIAYLRQPPPPSFGLAPFALVLMFLGAVVSFGISVALGLATAACVTLSVLYSHPRTRWKGIPGLDLAVNMMGYGAATTLAGLIVGQAVAGDPVAVPDTSGWLLVGAFGLLFGSFYPMTQIYQLTEDRARGDRTLAATIGPRGALGLALGLGLGAGVLMASAAVRWQRQPTAWPLWPLAITLVLWNGHTAVWLRRLDRLDRRAHERGMYRALALWALTDAALLIARYGHS
jgi:4-hydroxybenzoate polyprenyltransferase